MQGDQCERRMTRYASAHSELVAALAGPEDACELDRTGKLEPMRTTDWRRTNDVHKFESNSSSSRAGHGDALLWPARPRSRTRLLLKALPARLSQGL